MHLPELLWLLGMAFSSGYWRLQTGEPVFAIIGVVFLIGSFVIWLYVDPPEAKYALPPDSPAHALLAHGAMVISGFAMFSAAVYYVQSISVPVTGDQATRLAAWIALRRLEFRHLGVGIACLGLGMFFGNYLARSPSRTLFFGLVLAGLVICFLPWPRTGERYGPN